MGIFEASATHLMGGEITWKCMKAGSGPNAGKFKFQVKYYRDCNGIPPDANITLTTNAPGWGGGILCLPISTIEISPTGLGCPTCANPTGVSSTAQEIIYESAFIFISGTPPASGWNFWWQSCCRNSNITNLTLNAGMTLRAIMYPFGVSNTNPCYDSSPSFAEKPQLSTCAGNQTSYSHNAVDDEVDSLVFEDRNLML